MDDTDKALLEEARDKVFRNRQMRPNLARRLLDLIAKLVGEIEMWAANADSAALLAAGQAARIAELETNKCYKEMMQACDFLSTLILEDESVQGVGDNRQQGRLQVEFRNLRAQVAEAHAMGHPVSLFEKLADENKHGQTC